MNRVLRIAGVGAVCALTSAHVGSPDAWYSGAAGPYPILVKVAAPSVVPGIAKVSIVVTGQVSQVTAKVNKFDATAAAPPPDVAERDARNQSLFSADLWVMSSGSNAVTVAVDGGKGTGTAIIPVVIVQSRVLQMDAGMGMMLGGVGLFLLVGVLTIIGAAVREGVLPPGQEPDFARKKRARRVVAIATGLFFALLAGGWTWWNAEEAAYRSRIFKPLAASAGIDSSDSPPSLTFQISDSGWIKRRDSAWLSKNSRSAMTPLIADHGKLMHLFVVGGPGNSAFAHLHPSTADSITFQSSLPALPPGNYRLFGDVVHESGFSQTLVARLEIPATPSGAPAASRDPDDSWHIRNTGPQAGSYRLADGSTLTWEGSDAPVAAGAPATLRFALKDSAGNEAVLEPYMGMAGHAVVMRDDGGVFIHLHPGGTISTASQKTFLLRERGDSIAGTLSKRLVENPVTDHAGHASLGNTVSFPYAFPNAGKYHVWVQVRREGRVLTAAYEKHVGATPK